MYNLLECILQFGDFGCYDFGWRFDESLESSRRHHDNKEHDALEATYLSRLKARLNYCGWEAFELGTMLKSNYKPAFIGTSAQQIDALTLTLSPWYS